ncbi:MAG TPA: glycosyltransferase family 2 protein [Candidatus Saccharimonadales bacterium]|nr:glycosyltransferase family 2 protein [Candidatus Saccharimonadales bacterium]
MAQQLISIVVPMYNEARNLPHLYQEIKTHINKLPYRFEMLFVDDGSADESSAVVRYFANRDRRVRLIQLARNFGKEAAITAGLRATKGDAAVILDADLQMPPKLIGQFIKKWRAGSEVVVGVFASRNMSWLRRTGAAWFYRIIHWIGTTKITPHATDYRLLDRQVINVFDSLTERNRITRGLIDWLGFKQSYVHFEQAPRKFGRPTYSFHKLVQLAMNSITAYSMVPLKLAGYLGVFILMLSVPLGAFLLVERFVLKDPLHWGVNGTTLLATLIVFLVGTVLACLGLISLYIAHIHTEVINRPLYVVRAKPRLAQQSSVLEQVTPVTLAEGDTQPFVTADGEAPLVPADEPAAKEVTIG